MLCPACQRVLPASEPAEYTSRRAVMIVVHGLCLCAVSERPAKVEVVRTEITELDTSELDTSDLDTPAAGP